MEEALAPKPTKRGPSLQDNVIARRIAQDNQLMVQAKIDKEVDEKKKVKEREQNFLQKEMLKEKGEQTKNVGKKQEQRQLAEYYREMIKEKEEGRANQYQSKVQAGVAMNFFPFVDGERVKKDREVKSQEMNREMRSFLQRQREARPVRQDGVNPQLNRGHMVDYPSFPAPSTGRPPTGSLSERGPPGTPRAAGEGRLGTAGSALVRRPSGEAQASSQVDAPPRFEQRPEGLPRQQDDTHVRRALEAKVQETKNELAVLNQRKQLEMQLWEEGLAVSDAIGADSSQQKAIAVRRHGEDLKLQIADRERRAEAEKEEKRSQVFGYWGPDSKESKARGKKEDPREITKFYQAQMKVNKERKALEKQLQHRQEKRIVENCLVQIAEERDREAEKERRQREVLVTTWHSQKKIKEIRNEVEAAQGLNK